VLPAGVGRVITGAEDVTIVLLVPVDEIIFIGGGGAGITGLANDPG